MRLVFLVLAVLINFFNHSFIKSAEKIDSANIKIEDIAKKESINEDKTEIRKIHIVKTGDTISSISKLYSINKDLIIKLNNLKNENYIFVGQNLIISESPYTTKQRTNLINNYHIVQRGENLTEISSKYSVNLGYLIEINNLKSPDSIKVGEKILLRKNKKNNELNKFDKQIYGPLTIEDKSLKKIKGKTILNVLNKENKKLILLINCDKNELDVRIPGRKWRGGEPVREKFEKNLINNFC